MVMRPLCEAVLYLHDLGEGATYLFIFSVLIFAICSTFGCRNMTAGNDTSRRLRDGTVGPCRVEKCRKIECGMDDDRGIM